MRTKRIAIAKIQLFVTKKFNSPLGFKTCCNNTSPLENLRSASEVTQFVSFDCMRLNIGLNVESGPRRRVTTGGGDQSQRYAARAY